MGSTFQAYQPDRYEITDGTRRDEVHALTLAGANWDQYGNNARIALGTAIDDGRLNLSVVPPLAVGHARC